MASFTEVGEFATRDDKPSLKNDRFVHYEWFQVPVKVECADQSWEYKSTKGVLLAKDGALLLPYFKNGDGDWCVVITEQYRIATRSKSLEPAGGIVDETLEPWIPRTPEQAQQTMVKELREELGIEVNEYAILLVYNEFMSSSSSNATFWGGIVPIHESQLPQKSIHGEWQLKEWTILAVHNFVGLLRQRDSGEIKFDLASSRLLDELAKHLGLLKKMY